MKDIEHLESAMTATFPYMAWMIAEGCGLSGEPPCPYHHRAVWDNRASWDTRAAHRASASLLSQME